MSKFINTKLKSDSNSHSETSDSETSDSDLGNAFFERAI